MLHRTTLASLIVFSTLFCSRPAAVGQQAAVPASTPKGEKADKTEQLTGIVSSVNLETKKIAVTPTGKQLNVDVSVNDKTTIETSSGKTLALKDLKTGDGLGIAHVDNLASKIIVNVKPAELTGHVKSVASNLKTFVVTETGTDTDITVAVNGDTTLNTTEGKKLEMKELKKGDGVGISHVNSVASKVVVNVKPAAK